MIGDDRRNHKKCEINQEQIRKNRIRDDRKNRKSKRWGQNEKLIGKNLIKQQKENENMIEDDRKNIKSKQWRQKQKLIGKKPKETINTKRKNDWRWEKKHKE